MKGEILHIGTATIFAGMLALGILRTVWAADTPAPIDYAKISPLELVKNTPKGKLVTPLILKKASLRRAQNFQRYSCTGCHGGGGGGGMGPPLTNDTWVYGGDDDTLFRLVTLGSDELQKQGYTRKGHENIVGPMMPFGSIITNSDDLWKIITFIRSKYSGDPRNKFGK
jgi:hypothetical protein